MPIGSPTPEQTKNTREINGQEKIGDFELISPKYSAEDLVLNNITFQELKSAIALKTQSDYVYNTLGFAETHKHNQRFVVNFYGEPGTGKTMAAHAMAHAFSKKLLIVDYSQIESKYVGDTPKNLKKIFDFAKHIDCVIFFDEADAILSKRVTNMSSATDTSVNQTRSVMLNILNDFNGSIIFATNFISNYDSAFMRRILKHIHFDLPDHEARLKIIKKYLPKRISSTLDLELISQKSDGLSGADISNAALMAAFKIASENRSEYLQGDIEHQINNIKSSKLANMKKHQNESATISTRVVSKEYAEKQIGKELQ